MVNTPAVMSHVISVISICVRFSKIRYANEQTPPSDTRRGLFVPHRCRTSIFVFGTEMSLHGVPRLSRTRGRRPRKPLRFNPPVIGCECNPQGF
jgi:hypothetical protein